MLRSLQRLLVRSVKQLIGGTSTDVVPWTHWPMTSSVPLTSLLGSHELGKWPTRDSIQSRRIYLDRIHYYLYYSVDDRAEIVEVLAFWHASRGSSPEFG